MVEGGKGRKSQGRMGKGLKKGQGRMRKVRRKGRMDGGKKLT